MRSFVRKQRGKNQWKQLLIVGQDFPKLYVNENSFYYSVTEVI